MFQPTTEELRITSKAQLGREVRMPCPYCSEERKTRNQSIPVLSVNHKGDRILYNCHHCEKSGIITLERQQTTNQWRTDLRQTTQVVSDTPEQETDRDPLADAGLREISAEMISYFKGRGISAETLVNVGIKEANHYIRELEAKVPCVIFPYSHGGKSTGAKVRSFGNNQKGYATIGGTQGFWNIDFIDPEKPLYIVEGEIDALTLIEMGFLNVVSVPNGAPKKISNNQIDPSEDKKFSYIWKAREILEKVKKIIIAVDGDSAGNALAEELARRLNRQKCWRVKFGSTDKDKDANAYLQHKGQSALIELLNSSEAWPIAGLFDATKYLEAVRSVYDRGVPASESTGYDDIDDLYRVAPGQLTLVTGVPGSGKSEFVDQLMVNLAKTRDWKFAVCSFENQPDYHIIKLTEKYTRKSFFQSGRRMDADEREKALNFVQDHFLFLENAEEARSNIESVLDRATAAVMRIGIRGLVIDPYNYLEKKGEGASETEQVGIILTKVRQWAIAHSVHVWFIAHPQKLTRDSSGNVYVPKGYDVSGSANFFNVPDFGLTLHRRDNHVEFHNWKTRFKWWGKTGMACLAYDREISCYDAMQVNDEEVEEWKKKF